MPKDHPAAGDLEPLLSIDDLAPFVREVSKPAIYAWIRAGRFPRPVRIGPNMSAWLLSEVEAWQRARIAERDAHSGTQQTPATIAAQTDAARAKRQEGIEKWREKREAEKRAAARKREADHAAT